MIKPQRALVLPTVFLALAAAYRCSVGAPAPSAGSLSGGHYLAPGVIDPVSLLTPPPAMGSIAGRADLEAVLQTQAWRSAAQVAWAKRIADGDVFDNADVLGPWFTASNLPFTKHFVELVEDDVRGLVGRAKDAYNRPRPPAADPRVTPCVHYPSGASYPSGHASSIYARAGILAEVFPDEREALFAWADRAAWARVIGGVHFPTDLVAGRVLAGAVIEAMKKNADFRAAVERCQSEAAPFLLKKAS